MSDIKKQDKENFLEKIRLQDYNFHNIKCSNCSDEIEISKYGATYIFGGNGVGKTTISKNIFDSRSDMFHYFTYEENSDLVNGQLIVSKNEKNINDTNKKILEINKKIASSIDELLKKLNLSSGSNLFKNLIKQENKLILKNNWFISKKDSLNIDFLNIKTLNEIKNNLIPASNYNHLLELIKKYNKIEKDDFNNLKKLISMFKEQEKDFLIIVDDLSKFLEENDFFLEKEKIYNIVRNINSLEKCILCNQKVESWEFIKNRLESKINEYRNLILKKFNWEETINIINNFSKEFKKELGFPQDNYDTKLVNLIFDNINYFSELLERVSNELYEIINLLDAEISKIFMNEYEKYSLIDFLIISLNKINEWEKEKIPNAKIINEYNLILSFIEEKIGKGRIYIDKNDKKIIINNSKIEKSDELKNYLSTGERKFITFCFSLIFFIIENENKTIIIDDPFSSYDSENEYNIIYLINYFINYKKIKFLILTHSWQFISSQTMSEMIADKNRKDYFYILEKTFFENDQTFFLKKLCCTSKGDNSELKKYFSNKNFIHWIREENKEFIRKNIDLNSELNEYIIFMFSILPIIRGYLKFTKNNCSKCLNKLMHYCSKKIKINDIDDIDIFISDLFEFFNLNKKEVEKLNNNENKIREMYKKIVECMLKYEVDKNTFKCVLNLSDKEISKQLKKLFNILFLRKYLEKILIKKLLENLNTNNNYCEVDILNNNFNIFNLINECKKNKIINDEIALVLKSKRVFINCFSHLERLNNYIIPLFELDIHFVDKTIKFIEKI